MPPPTVGGEVKVKVKVKVNLMTHSLSTDPHSERSKHSACRMDGQGTICPCALAHLLSEVATHDVRQETDARGPCGSSSSCSRSSRG